MTASELARLLGAKRSSKGKWVCRCPVHDDRTPSLAIAEGRKGIVLKCMSAGCDTKSILDALGLRWADLFRGEPTKEIRGRLADERRLEKLDRKFGLVLWLLALDKAKRNYWLTAARRAGQERRVLREKLNPELKRVREFQEKVKRLGWDSIWREFLASDKGRKIDERYGILDGSGPHHGSDGAGSGAGPDADDLRKEILHDTSPQLQDGRDKEG